MKRITLIGAMLVLTLGAAKPAAAQGRYIVRTTGGLSSVLNLCNLLKCQVQGGLDGPVGQTFLVTSTNNLLDNLVNGVLTLAESLLGIVSVEVDKLLPIPLPPLASIPSGLYDTAPSPGTVTWFSQQHRLSGFKMHRTVFELAVPVSSPLSILAWTSTIPSSQPC